MSLRTFLPARADFASLLRLSAPIIAVQLGMMVMNVVDAMLVGRLSTEALAAVAMGGLYLWGVSVVSMGVLLSLDPIVSQAVGAGDEEAVARAVQRGLVLTAALSVVSMAAMVPTEPFMRAMQQPEPIIPTVRQYVWINAVGILPFFAFTVFRQSLQAMHRVGPLFVAVGAANVLNVVLSYGLIFGRLGMPGLGVAGSAWGTVLSRWFMLALLLGLSWRVMRSYLTPLRSGITRREPLMRMVRIGMPIGMTMALEFGAFAVVMMYMGALGTTQVAAHQVALTLAALTFMVPLGIGQAAAVQVGRAIGGGDGLRARRAAVAALVAGASFMVATAGGFFAVPELLARAYTEDAATIALASLLIPIAAWFQVFDGLQAVASGVLRGAGDTRAPMLMQLFGLWLIGLPVGIALGLDRSMGAVGLWWGFVAGLAAVAIPLCVRVYLRLRRPASRIEIEETAEPVTH